MMFFFVFFLFFNFFQFSSTLKCSKTFWNKNERSKVTEICDKIVENPFCVKIEVFGDNLSG